MAGNDRRTDAQPAPVFERSTSQILTDIIGKVQDIIRSEVALAKTEIREEAAKAARASILMVAGGILALYALGFLFQTLAHGLGLALPAWAASGIVALVLFIAAGVLLAMGRGRLRTVHAAPEKTISTLKEDVEWVKHLQK